MLRWRTNKWLFEDGNLGAYGLAVGLIKQGLVRQKRCFLKTGKALKKLRLRKAIKGRLNQEESAIISGLIRLIVVFPEDRQSLKQTKA